MYTYEKELHFIVEAIRTGYAQYAEKSIEKTENKTTYDLVTFVDYGVEKHLISAINEQYPDDFILSEEFNSFTEIKNRTWTIDPIDGTVNMACGIPVFGIQCSLVEDGEPVLGVIYLPTLGELYTAIKGRGAFLNGKSISVSHRDLEHCIVSFGDFPHEQKEDAMREQKIMAKLSERVSKIRMFGAASVDFAFVAAGRTSGTIIFTKNKWDIVPGIILCKEAGAEIRALGGAYSFDDSVVIAAADKTVYEAILAADRS